MDMIETMRRSEAVEISLRNGHVLYGRFLGVSGKNFILCDPDGAVVFVPFAEENLAYVKVVSSDPEIGRVLDRLYGERPSRQPVEPRPGIQAERDEFPPRRVDSPSAQAPVDPQPGRVDTPPTILNGLPSSRQAAIEEIKERHRHANNTFASSQSTPRPAFRPRIQREDEEE